jgi:hypothetical protein
VVSPISVLPEAAELIRTKKLSPVEYVTALLARMTASPRSGHASPLPSPAKRRARPADPWLDRCGPLLTRSGGKPAPVRSDASGTVRNPMRCSRSSGSNGIEDLHARVKKGSG